MKGFWQMASLTNIALVILLAPICISKVAAADSKSGASVKPSAVITPPQRNVAQAGSDSPVSSSPSGMVAPNFAPAPLASSPNASGALAPLAPAKSAAPPVSNPVTVASPKAPPLPGVNKAGTTKPSSAAMIEDTTQVKVLKKTEGGIGSTDKDAEEHVPPNLFEDDKSFLAGLDYPELQVVPRASERLAMEVQEDRSSFIGNYWAVQVSAVALIAAGSNAAGKYRDEDTSAAQKKENEFSAQLGTLVGAMWLGASVYLDYSSSYSKALNEIRKINGKDKKSLLLKERMAEESLERSAKIAQSVTNFSVWTSFAIGAYIAGHSRQELPSYAALAMGLSFLPWLVDNRLVDNWDKHLEYKRKIYAPITKIDLMIDPKTGQATPLLGLQWRF